LYSKSNSDDPLKLIAIKTKEKVYISDNVKNDCYFHSYIERYLFDGEAPTKTFKQHWYEIKDIPVLIQQQLPRKQINSRYELKEAFHNTEFPKTLHSSDFDEDTGKYESVHLVDRCFQRRKNTRLRKISLIQ